MRIKYQDKKFRADTLAVVDQATQIIDEYWRQGFELTLRQLYYQFVARDLLPNTQRSYKRLGSIISDARLAGLIDWSSIVDRTRNLQSSPHWADESEILAAVAQQFTIDKWEHQSYRPEVWIEKEALIGVIKPSCRELDVPFFACRGYVSQSEQWAAGRRFRSYRGRGQVPMILHLGDHDPSGIDMTRDNGDRLGLFAEHYVEVRRLALNMDQVDRYSPPPNPAKMTDARFEGYVREHGEESWELDALDPPVIQALIQEAIGEIRDPVQWGADVIRETAGRENLQRLSDNWEDVEAWLEESR